MIFNFSIDYIATTSYNFNMNLVFKTNKTTIRVLAVIEFLLLFAPITASLLLSDKLWEAILVAAIIYLAYSPLTFLLGRMLYKYYTIRIIITGDELHYKSIKNSFSSKWNQIKYLKYDYIAIENSNAGITQFYQLYEVACEKNKFRFLVNLNKFEIDRVKDFSKVNNFSKKAFMFDSYGIYLNRKDCSTLIAYLQDFTGIETERHKGLFYNNPLSGKL